MEIIYKKLKEIKPYERNPRINKAAVDPVANSIREFGFKVPIVIDKDGIIVAGHTRFKAAKKLGLAEVPCITADDLSEEQIKAFRIADNKTAEKAEWDFDLLNEELGDIFNIDMTDFGFSFDPDSVIPVAKKTESAEPSEEEQEQIFREKMARGEISEENEEYQDFLDKFKLKKTTDDCYTPDNIYETVKDWCVERYGLGGMRIVRPFYPGGDYQKEEYPKNCVVIDNPPFSIISEICDFYAKEGIPYFMFAPALTLLGIARGEANYVATGVSVTYENGANVSTSFVTNLGNIKILASSDLNEKIKEANKANLRNMHKEIPKYTYPDEVLTSTMLGYIAAHGVDLEISKKDVYFIRALDAQKESGKGLFGSGYLLSPKAAAEKAAAEKAAAEKAAAEKAAAEKAAAEKRNSETWELSEREREIIKTLGSEMNGGFADMHRINERQVM